MEFPLWVTEECLTLGLGAFSVSDERMEQEVDRQLGASSTVMRALLWFVVVKGKLSQKAKLSIYWSIFVPTLADGHEI